MLKIKYSILSIVSFLLISTQLFAQSTGKLAGKITDRKTGETLIGATIGIQGSSKGAATNAEGRYILSELQAGRYTLIIRYIGYQSKSISDIEIKAGAVTQLDATLDEATTQALKEVTIKATYRQESVNALYARQKNSVQVMDGIYADVIKR